MDGAGQFLARSARIGEVESAFRIEGQIVRLDQRLAVAAGGNGAEDLSLRVQSQDGAPAGVADQMRAVGQYLVSAGRAGLGPDTLPAVGRDAADHPAVRDVGVSARVEYDPLGKAAKPSHLDRMQP